MKLVEVIEDILGEYTPYIDEVTGEVLPGLAGLDIEWIFAAILFCMGVRFCFKILYAMAKWIWKA